METPTPHPHAELIKAWADGEIIQYHSHGDLWVDCETMPNWDSDSEYRIKPKENESWKPKEGEKFFYLDEVLVIHSDNYDEYNDAPLLLRGNCFRTRKEAEAAVPRVEDALKGDTDVSGKVGSSEIDGKPLSDGEKALIRAFRDYPIEEVCGCDKRNSILIYKNENGHFEARFSHISVMSLGTKVCQNHALLAALEQIKAEQEAQNEA